MSRMGDPCKRCGRTEPEVTFTSIKRKRRNRVLHLRYSLCDLCKPTKSASRNRVNKRRSA